MGRQIYYDESGQPIGWQREQDSPEWLEMAHSAIFLAYLVSRFEADGYLTLPSAMDEDLEKFRQLRAAWVTS